MTASDASVRDFRPDDLEAVLALRERVFPGLDLPRERRRWTWEYAENPARVAGVPDAWVIERAGRLVGNYGLLPARVSIDGAVGTAFAGIDFAVDPSMQGRGLGHLIAARFMDPALCRFPFISSPTPATCHLMQRHGGTVITGADEPCLWVLPLAAGRPDPAVDASITLRQIATFDARFDHLDRRLRTLRRIATVRDAAYLNWRYRDYPFGRPTAWEALDACGELRGFAVFQHDPNLAQGYVLELSLDPADRGAATTLLHAAVAAARACDVHELYTLNRLPAVQAILAASGFHRVDGHSMQFVCRPPNGLGAADCYLTTGDGDVLFGVGDLQPR